MASEFTIPKIIQFAQISQYLAGNDKSRQNQLNSGSLIGNLPDLLYMEGYLLQNIFNLNPSSSLLRSTAEYVLSLCGKYGVQANNILNNLAQSPPVITGPVNESVNVGDTAVFSVSVAGTAPFTYAWYLNGVLIPGATSSSYSKTNAQLSDSGGVYSVKVSNPAAPSGVFSNTATLTVTAALIALTWYGDTDPATDLQANIDNFSYQITTNITHNNPISITIPQVATPNKYFVTKVPIGESLKTTWFNTPTNQGTFSSDFNYQNPIQFNGFTYYYSRQALSMDFTQPLVLS